MQYINTETFNKPKITKATLSVYIKKLNNIQLTKSNLLHELKDVSDQISTANVQLSLESDRSWQENNQLKTSTIEAQETVIRLQNELLISKDKQLSEVHTAVQRAVEESVKTEIVIWHDRIFGETSGIFSLCG